MTTDRHTFLQLLTTGALSAVFPASISRALQIPARRRSGTVADVEYIVILMQENRSFDHYFGTLRGVRGLVIRTPSTFDREPPFGTNQMARELRQPKGAHRSQLAESRQADTLEFQHPGDAGFDFGRSEIRHRRQDLNLDRAQVRPYVHGQPA